MTSRAASRTARTRAAGDEGFALITTLLTISLLAAFSLVVLQQTISNTAASRKDQDWVAALGAAQAGVDDYVRRLNDSNGAYFTWSSSNPDPDNPAMAPVSATAGWADIVNADLLPDGTAPPARGRFHYDVDTSRYTGATAVHNGNIVVTSTGKVGKRTRTLTATVRRSGFLDFVYFTDMDTQDPLDYPVTAIPSDGIMSRADATVKCPFYYASRAGQNCIDPIFNNDTLSGPVHSNDRMLICANAVFKDAVTTMVPKVNGIAYRTTDPNCSDTSGTTFARPGDPTTVPRVNLPSTNLGLKAQTSVAASPRGCLYTGPTKILVSGGRIKVRSPWTRTLTPGCLHDQYFTIPANGVVYVDRVPSDNVTTDDNSWRSGETPPPCPAANKNNVDYPAIGEKAGSWDYPCRAGDVFIEQEGGSSANALNGRLTVAASNNLYITNHLEYASGSNSFLGLIAEQFIYLWHPIDANGANLPLPGQSTAFVDARIHAALLSVNHAISVQNYLHGASLGTLNITGALAQKFRGVVRYKTSGYTAKNYVYDQRLRYDAPPRFLNPTLNAFAAVRTAERKAAYS